MINTFKKLFDVGQREVIFLFILVTNKGDHSIFSQIKKHWHDKKLWEKESNTVKGARGQSRMDHPEKLVTFGTQDTRWRQTKQKHNTICVGHHRMQTNRHNVNHTWALLQATEGVKYERIR